MTLLSRLGISHAVLAATLALALGLLMVSHGRIYGLMGDVRERELASLDQEEAVYRAAWAVELAARQGATACEHGMPTADPVRALATAMTRLRGLPIASTSSLRPVATRYLAFAGRVVAAPDPCAVLRGTTARQERLALDEEATEAWISRSYELHRAIH